MSTENIIGLAGKAGSGKDTAGAFLSTYHGYRRFAYADALKRAALDINPIIFDDERLAPLVVVHGMDFVKRAYPEARRFLQELGTSMRGVDEQIWLRPLDMMAFALAPESGIVVTDVRFDNEAQQIIDLGGIVVNIVRTGAGLSGAEANHASEAGVSEDLIDTTIHNDGSLEDLRSAVASLVNGEGDYSDRYGD